MKQNKKKTDLDAVRGTKTTLGAYQTQPISDDVKRFEKTRVACPTDDDVARNREWVQENKL